LCFSFSFWFVVLVLCCLSFVFFSVVCFLFFCCFCWDAACFLLWVGFGVRGFLLVVVLLFFFDLCNLVRFGLFCFGVCWVLYFFWVA